MTWHATLDLRYQLAQGRTVVRHRHAGPLRVLKSMHPEDARICHSVLVHPEAILETRRARAALQGAYELKEFVAQSANLALVLAGCHAGDAGLVREGLRDVLVEPRRAPLIVGFGAAKQAALDANAMGASISGAGPSVFAWFESRGEAEAAAPAVQAAFAAAGFDSQAWVSPINATGAELLSAT